MATFTFQAINEQGKEVKETIDAPSKDEAVRQIRARRLKLMEIKETKGSAAAKTPGARKRGTYFGRVSTAELSQFTRQLATLQDAGLPIVRSLRILEGQLKPCQLKDIVFDVAEDVNQGMSLSDAMQKHPKAFDKLFVNLVKAGEAGGVLDTILDKLAIFMEKSEKLKSRIIGAMIYPTVVISIAILILSAIMIFIIPSFEKMFLDMKIDLPGLTKGIVSLSRFIGTNWFLIPLLPVIIMVLMQVVKKNAKLSYVWDGFTLHAPVFGTIINKSTMSRFCRTFGTLISSGVPILEALAITRDAIANRVVVSALQKVHDSIKEGDNIADPLAATKICDDMVVNMISVGEETGEMDKMLVKVADTYDEDVDTAVEALTKLIEPFMIVFLGGSVGTIVIALFLPMIELIKSNSKG